MTDPIRADEMIDAELDRQTIAHLEDDLDPKCGFGNRVINPHTQQPSVQYHCENPASWLVRCVRCRCGYWCCDEHRTRLMAGANVRCTHCEARSTNLFSFQRIGGARCL